MRDSSSRQQEQKRTNYYWLGGVERSRLGRAAASLAALSGIALNAALYAPMAFAQGVNATPGASLAAGTSGGLKQILLLTGITLVAASLGLFAVLMNRQNRERAAWEARRIDYEAWERRRASEEIVRAASTPASETFASVASPAREAESSAGSKSRRKSSSPAREAETLMTRMPEPAAAGATGSGGAAEAGTIIGNGTAARNLPPAGYGAVLRVVGGPDEGLHFAVTKPVLTMGREDRDILFSDDSISRRHAVLRVQTTVESSAPTGPAGDGVGAKASTLRFVLYDENSLHGTRVNGEAVGGRGRELQSGDQIALGKGRTVLLFERASEGNEGISSA